MGQNSKIEWTDATWNPIEGCSMAKGSENGGCLNCYAARTALRRPAAGLAVMRESGPRWTGKVGLVETRLDAPLNWKKPQRIFVNSMSDLFHESLPDEVIDRVFAVMAVCPQHTFQVLTKRPERMLHVMTKVIRTQKFWPLPNVWLGVSVEGFPTWDSRVHLLKATPAARRFISYEPALAPLGCIDLEGVDWLIAGGESGPGARPAHPDWFRSARDQCVAAGVPFFFKQWGEWLPGMQDGALLEGQPQILNSSDVPERIGKKKAGALLDGVAWKQFPEVRCAKR